MTDEKKSDAVTLVAKREEEEEEVENEASNVNTRTETAYDEKEKVETAFNPTTLEEARKREQQKRLELLLDKTAKYTHFLSSSLGKDTYGSGSSGGDPREPEKKKAKGSDGKGSANAKLPISQPPTVTGGVLRYYQLEALNWLIQLFENGITTHLNSQFTIIIIHNSRSSLFAFKIQHSTFNIPKYR